LSRLWTAGYLVASLLLLLRVFLGPFAIRSPLNLESFTFLFFAFAIVSGRTPLAKARGSVLTRNRKRAVVHCLLIAAIAIAVYWPSIQTPFLFDDYTHLALVRSETWSAVVARALLTHPQGGDYFFRPLGYVSYWLDYRWAGENAALWHGWNVLVHTLNSLLVYTLCRTLLLRPLSSLLAAALFSVNAGHVEVVCWMAARFDLLAFLFTIVALIALRRYVVTNRPAWLIAMLSGCLLALLSKEAAFCLPLLAVCLIPFDPPSYRRTLKSAGALAIMCCVVFAYRLWFLGGIGGYRTSAGTPAILNFSLFRTAKALFYRQWAILSWPVNWSLDLNNSLKFGFILMVAAGLLAIACCRPKRAVFGACIALILAAALPAQQLLLIGADLAGARVLYLPTLGMAVLWGVLLESSTKWQAGVLLSGGLLFFQIAALEHNLTIWKDVARLSHETCASFAKEIGPGEQRVRVRDLPRMRNGVFFLTNGFGQCVGKPDRVIVDDGSQVPSAGRVFAWSDAAKRIVPVDESSSDKRK
jgi:hypothetical protein